MEAGEVWKIEPSYLEVAQRGVRNVLIDLKMVEGKPTRSPYQAEVDRSRWLRSPSGGILHFHVAPGEVVDQNQPLATCSNLLGREPSVLTAPLSGVIMGMTTLPAVKPGDPVCHLAIPKKGVRAIRRALSATTSKSLEERVRGDLASNVTVQEAPDEVE
jgi:predicted deacylase